MHRCEGGAALRDNHEGLTTDPDWVDDHLDDLFFGHGHFYWYEPIPARGVWSFTPGMQVSAREMQEKRDRQIAILARYGKQSMTQWDDLDVIEFERCYNTLVDLLNEESAAQKAKEDHV